MIVTMASQSPEKLIPKYFSKNYLRKNAAQIFISATKESAYRKQEAVAFVFIFIKHLSNHSYCKSPDNTKRSPNHTASAHPHAFSYSAKNSFRYITKKRSYKKQQYYFIKTTSVGKNLSFTFFFWLNFYIFSFLCFRISFVNTSVYKINYVVYLP